MQSCDGSLPPEEHANPMHDTNCSECDHGKPWHIPRQGLSTANIPVLRHYPSQARPVVLLHAEAYTYSWQCWYNAVQCLPPDFLSPNETTPPHICSQQGQTCFPLSS